MEKSLTYSDNDAFYQQLLDMETRHEAYSIDTGVMEAGKMPLRLLHHIGISKDEIDDTQPRTFGSVPCVVACG